MDSHTTPVPSGEVTAPSTPSVDTGSEPSDNDSAVEGLSSASSTTSLRSSIYDHVEEGGRTYHRYKDEYPLPNDPQEQDRLDLQHALFLVTLNRNLHLAPIGPTPQNVLDIATGTGIWAIEFAQQYPSAQIVGTDLSPIQPDYLPPNCRFEIDDAEDEWTFDIKFNYVHGRALLSCFRNPASIIQKAFDSLAPGGYLELQDGTFPFKYIGEPPKESSLYKWNEVVVAGAAKLGRPWTNAQHYKRWMEEIGFADVVEINYYWPSSTWAKGSYYKQVARYWQADILEGLEAISLRVMKAMDWSVEEIQVLLAGVRNDIKDTSIHAYLPISVVYGRKPVDTCHISKVIEA